MPEKCLAQKMKVLGTRRLKTIHTHEVFTEDLAGRGARIVRETTTVTRILMDDCDCDKILSAIRNSLTSRQWDVLSLHYLEGLTLEEIGPIIGVHRERVRHIERAAMLRIRRRPNLMNMLRYNEDPFVNSCLFGGRSRISLLG